MRNLWLYNNGTKPAVTQRQKLTGSKKRKPNYRVAMFKVLKLKFFGATKL